MGSKRRRLALSCVDCRRRKVKCGRELPTCVRCIKGGNADNCQYVQFGKSIPLYTRPTASEAAASVTCIHSTDHMKDGIVLTMIQMMDPAVCCQHQQTTALMKYGMPMAPMEIGLNKQTLIIILAGLPLPMLKLLPLPLSTHVLRRSDQHQSRLPSSSYRRRCQTWKP